MEHPEIKRLLYAFYDSRLGPEMTVEISDHVAACRECSGVLAEFRRLSAGSDGPLSDEAAAEIIKRVQGPPEVIKPRSNPWPIVMGAVIAVLILIMASGVWVRYYRPDLWGKVQGILTGTTGSLPAVKGKR